MSILENAPGGDFRLAPAVLSLLFVDISLQRSAKGEKRK